MASIFFDQKMSSRYTHQGDTFHHVEGGNNGKKVQARGKGNGRTHVNLGTNEINQTDHLAQKFQQKAQAVADALHKVSPTKANFTHGQPNGWNLDNMTSATFTADRPHGIPVGHKHSFKGGEVEAINNTQARVTRVK